MVDPGTAESTRFGARSVSTNDHGKTVRASRARLWGLLAAMTSRGRRVRVVKKSAHWHQRAAARALWALTLGGQRTYLSEYVTTLGHTIYVPDDFALWRPDQAWATLRHELVHVEQFERLGWLGMILVYGFFPLPAGLAWGRARLEWEAYRETLRARAELRGMRAARSPKLHRHIVARFTGPDYGWMWPFPRAVQRWIDAALDEIRAGAGAAGVGCAHAGRPALEEHPAPPRRAGDHAADRQPRSPPRAHRRQRHRLRRVPQPGPARGARGDGDASPPREPRGAARAHPQRGAGAGRGPPRGRGQPDGGDRAGEHRGVHLDVVRRHLHGDERLREHVPQPAAPLVVAARHRHDLRHRLGRHRRRGHGHHRGHRPALAERRGGGGVRRPARHGRRHALGVLPHRGAGRAHLRAAAGAARRARHPGAVDDPPRPSRSTSSPRSRATRRSTAAWRRWPSSSSGCGSWRWRCSSAAR